MTYTPFDPNILGLSTYHYRYDGLGNRVYQSTTEPSVREYTYLLDTQPGLAVVLQQTRNLCIARDLAERFRELKQI